MPHALRRPNLYAPRPQPMSAMNVTPFIDVLLVLLIMLILAIPAQVNVTEVDLGGEASPRYPILEANSLTIDEQDRTLWNGQQVTTTELRALIAAASNLPIEPVLRFEPDARASYDTAARTIALIREEGADTFQFVGNDRYRNLD